MKKIRIVIVALLLFFLPKDVLADSYVTESSPNENEEVIIERNQYDESVENELEQQSVFRLFLPFFITGIIAIIVITVLSIKRKGK